MSTINTHFCITVMKKGTMLFKVSTIHFSQCMYLAMCTSRKFVPILFKIISSKLIFSELEIELCRHHAISC